MRYCWQPYIRPDPTRCTVQFRNFRILLDGLVETAINRFDPVPSEGRFAIVTNVGRGMRWTRWRGRRTLHVADGEVVWSWRLDAGVKSAD
jgi:hypothetical protein